MVLDALAFPLRRDNAVFLALGMALCSIPPAVAMLLPNLPYVGLMATLVECVVLCYVLVYFHSVMEASTRGDERLPMWPDEADLQNLAGQAFHVIVPFVLSFLPLIVFVVQWVFRKGTWEMTPGALAAAGGLFAFGFLYLPMALLVFSFYGELGVVNVVAVARSIARIGRDYFVVSGLLMALFLLHGAAAGAVAAARLPSLLLIPAGSLLFFYAMLVAMRAVGRLYAQHKERLGWER